MNTALQTVHVRLNDGATGQPTSACVRFTTEEGDYYPPLGRLANFATGRNQDVGGNLLLGRRAWAYTDGSFEIRLPPGTLHIEAHKGLEYLPLCLDHHQAQGKISMRFQLDRWTNLREQGWYAGDTRCHFLTPHAALLEAEGEDLAVVNILAEEVKLQSEYDREATAVPGILSFSGQLAALESAGHLVAVNTHNRHRVLGSLGLLHCHRVVFPLRLDTEPGYERWTLEDWCGQCHRKRGLVVWTDTAHETAEFRFGEPLADCLLGYLDAFEMIYYEDSPFDVLPDWYDLLNCGVRIPLVGAGGKDSNRIAMGSMRTYAQLNPGEALTYKNWIEAVRAGRTFITNGPLPLLTVNGQPPGSTVRLAAGKSASIVVEAKSIVPFEDLELLLDDTVIAHAPASGSPITSARLVVSHPISNTCWLAARCRGQHQLFHCPSNVRVFAHTSPVYLTVPDHPFQKNTNACKRFRKELNHMIDWAKKASCYQTDAQREPLLKLLNDARSRV